MRFCRPRSWVPVLFGALLLLVGGCSSPGLSDAGSFDLGVADSGGSDAGAKDAGDAGVPDASSVDAGDAGGAAPSFSEEPSDQTVRAGESATFRARAQGEPAPTLQ